LETDNQYDYLIFLKISYFLVEYFPSCDQKCLLFGRKCWHFFVFLAHNFGYSRRKILKFIEKLV